MALQLAGIETALINPTYPPPLLNEMLRISVPTSSVNAASRPPRLVQHCSSGVAVVTGVDGEITVTPTPGFLGTTTFSYFVVGDPDHVATATVTVTGNTPPIAADDVVSVTAGTDTTFDPSVLLANDVDPTLPKQVGRHS